MYPLTNFENKETFCKILEKIIIHVKTLQKVSVECSNDMIEFLSSNIVFCRQGRVNPGA